MSQTLYKVVVHQVVFKTIEYDMTKAEYQQWASAQHGQSPIEYTKDEGTVTDRIVEQRALTVIDNKQNKIIYSEQ